MLLSTYTKQNMLFFAVEVQVLGPQKKQTTPLVICMSGDWGFVPLYEFTVQKLHHAWGLSLTWQLLPFKISSSSQIWVIIYTTNPNSALPRWNPSKSSKITIHVHQVRFHQNGSHLYIGIPVKKIQKDHGWRRNSSLATFPWHIDYPTIPMLDARLSGISGMCQGLSLYVANGHPTFS